MQLGGEVSGTVDPYAGDRSRSSWVRHADLDRLGKVGECLGQPEGRAPGHGSPGTGPEQCRPDHAQVRRRTGEGEIYAGVNGSPVTTVEPAPGLPRAQAEAEQLLSGNGARLLFGDPRPPLIVLHLAHLAADQIDPRIGRGQSVDEARLSTGVDRQRVTSLRSAARKRQGRRPQMDAGAGPLVQLTARSRPARASPSRAGRLSVAA